VSTLTILTLLILAGPILDVQVMRTPSELRRGLQGHPPLSSNEGMLFVMPAIEDARFWMKDVTYPIDIIFIRPDGKIANIRAGVPPCRTFRCPVYRSDGPVSHVLEIDGGMAAQYGLTAGSKLRLDAAGRRVYLPGHPKGESATTSPTR